MKLGRIIAQRELKEKNKRGSKLRIFIGAPRYEANVWVCPFAIEGLGLGVQPGTGEDSLQALVSALAGVRASIDDSGRELYWLEPEYGHFIPLRVPGGGGKEFEDRVAQAIEREEKRRMLAVVKTQKKKLDEREKELRKRGLKPDQIKAKLKRHRTSLADLEKQITAEAAAVRPGLNLVTEMTDGHSM